MAGTDDAPHAEHSTLLIFISTCAGNAARRHAIRRSWFQFLSSGSSPLASKDKARVQCIFLAARGDPELDDEAEREGDLLLVDAPEGYEHLWRKALTFLQLVVNAYRQHGAGQDEAGHAGPLAPDAMLRLRFPTHPAFVMHADDDSYVRLDLLLPIVDTWPRVRHYWGYIWDGTGARSTAPIRNPRNKSYMPEHQYPHDTYPPFASGCGFVLSWDLVAALAAAAPSLPDYRLLDPPFGIHLCAGGPPGAAVVMPPVVPVHDERVRPYRPLPTFRTNTLVQHYLKPEEMVPYHAQALEHSAAKPGETELLGKGGGVESALRSDSEGCLCGAGGKEHVDALGGGSAAAADLYAQLVAMGLLRR